MNDVRKFLDDVGFQTKRGWVADNKGVIKDFPVRTFIDFLRSEGMMHVDSYWEGEKIIHEYMWGQDSIFVIEWPGRKTVLSMEFGGFTFMEEVKTHV